MNWDEEGSLMNCSILSLQGNPIWVTVGTEPLGSQAALTNLTGGDIREKSAGSGRFLLLNTEQGTSYTIEAA